MIIIVKIFFEPTQSLDYVKLYLVKNFFILALIFSCSKKQVVRSEPPKYVSKKTITDIEEFRETSVYLRKFEDSNSYIKSEEQLRDYFIKFEEKSSQSHAHSTYEDYVDSIIKYSKKIQDITGIPWKFNSCNMFVESRFNESEDSAPAHGISQIHKVSITEQMKDVNYESLDKDEYKRCREIVPLFGEDNTYQRYLSRFECDPNDTKVLKECKKAIKWCSDIFRKVYRAEKYTAFGKEYFYDRNPKTLIIPYKLNWRKIIDSSDIMLNQIYPYFYQHNIFLSSFHLFSLTTKIDGYLYYRGKKFFQNEYTHEEILENIDGLISSDLDRFRALQLLGAAYNGGKSIIDDVLISKNLKSFDEMYQQHLINLKSKKSGPENKAHMLKLGRCLHINDDRAPYFSKEEKNSSLDSFDYI